MTREIVSDFEQTAREARAQTAALRDPVFAAGRHLHRELMMAGHAAIYPSGGRTDYSILTVRVRIQRPQGMRHTRKEMVSLLVKNREFLAEDPAALLDLKPGERVYGTELRVGGYDTAYWRSVDEPNAAQLRAMASEIP